MKKALTKTEIYRDMLEICHNSSVIKQKRIETPWKLNVLLYCLELLDFNYDIHIDLNTTRGELIPVGSYKNGPAYIPACERDKTFNIVGFESYLINEDDPEEGYIYLLIIEEVQQNVQTN